MSNLSLMVGILQRSRLAGCISLYRRHQVSASFVTLGVGTATSETLDCFGLDRSDKAVTLSLVTDGTWAALKRDLQSKMHIDVPGTGIAFTVPLSSIGGKRELQFLTEGQDYVKGEESTLQDTTHQLLVIIANHGYTDLIMDAAREAGAAGGTVLHAKGTGMERAERFLGISLAAEKELLLIVARTTLKNAIMQAVMAKAGMETPAQSIVFSLPVTSTAGLRLVEEE
ncbi:MAG: P-II family nitrogen regulator [Oscillospiraceae bacterium]|nr:P-II family nitrogen regulator [Oscillospiraceae bacterium]